MARRTIGLRHKSHAELVAYGLTFLDHLKEMVEEKERRTNGRTPLGTGLHMSNPNARFRDGVPLEQLDLQEILERVASMRVCVPPLDHLLCFALFSHGD